jgi:hypothetical protein
VDASELGNILPRKVHCPDPALAVADLRSVDQVKAYGTPALEGYPAAAPPWRTLNAIDLNTGKYLWKIPLGQYPKLAAEGLSHTGTKNYGGPIVTVGGLLLSAQRALTTNSVHLTRPRESCCGKPSSLSRGTPCLQPMR